MKLPVLSRGGLAVLIVCSLCAPGAAQAPNWIPAGPFGGTIDRLAVHPTIPGVLYAAVPGGLVRTRDAGVSWQWLPGASGLSAVAIDPTRPRTLYAASPMPLARIFKSTDEGARWKVVSQNLPAGLIITCLVVDPARPSRLYLTATTGGIWRSGDGGVTWQRLSQGLPAGGATNVPILVVPRKPGGTAFAGTLRSGLFRTRNAGGSWEPVRGGLPTGSVGGLAIAPGAGVSHQHLGVWKSTDSGASWQATGLDGRIIRKLAASPEPGVLWAGTIGGEVYRSTDFGETWQELSGPLTLETFGFAFAPDRVYAATNNGVWILEED